MNKEKIRSYTNTDGMVVEVSKEHLDYAVDIKLELQESTYGRRCNWNMHKNMMEKEGFFDSDTNESYRCLIKDYQKEIGKLAKVSSYANFVAEGKLEAIKHAVGEMYYAKQDNQQVLRELNKIKRQITTSALAVEELRNVYIDEISFDVPHYIYQPKLPSGDNKGICVITDWHIGVVVNNCLGNHYNYEIAQKRINKLKHEVLDYCRLYNVTDLSIVGLGDWIEHIHMRKNQSQDCEFGRSMQIAKAQKLLLEFIVSMAEYLNVEVELIAGNHDREHGEKDSSFDGDNAVVVINEGISDMIELINQKQQSRIKFIKSDPHKYEIIKAINGKKFKFIHGDRSRGNLKDKLPSTISLDNEFYDCLVHGHFHNWYVQESDHGRFIVGIGCLMGRNNYSKDMYCATNANQGLIIVREDGTIIPIRIELQIV